MYAPLAPKSPLSVPIHRARKGTWLEPGGPPKVAPHGTTCPPALRQAKRNFLMGGLTSFSWIRPVQANSVHVEQRLQLTASRQGLPRRSRCPPLPPLRSLRTKEWHHQLRPPGRSDDEAAPLPPSAEGLLDRRQRHRPPRPPRSAETSASLSQPPWARPRELAQSDRGLLLSAPAQGAYAHDFSSFPAVAHRILGLQRHYQSIARPLEWRFTRKTFGTCCANSTLPSLQHDRQYVTELLNQGTKAPDRQDKPMRRSRASKRGSPEACPTPGPP